MAHTQKDIAREVGVSVMTVSRALGNRPGVSAEKRSEILQAARRLRYSISGPQATTSAIGVLVDNLESEYISEIIYGIYDILMAASHALQLYAPVDMIANPEKNVLETCQHSMVGLVIASAVSFNNEGVLSSLLQHNFPLVLVDQVPKDLQIPYVTVSNYQGAFDATHYLIQLGHRLIGFIKGPPIFEDSFTRFNGYRDALIQAGIPLDERLIVNGDYTLASGRRAGQEFLAMDNPPTAIFASNDNMALGLLETWRAAGKCIPDELSIIGFDDIRSAAFSTPALTTVRTPLREMGHTAARILLRMVHNKSGAHNAELKTSLVMRQSCVPLRGID